MRTRDKERLVLGALCALSTAFAFVGRDGRFGGFDRYSWVFVGLTIGWLIKSFLPEPEKWGPISYGTRIAVWLIAIVALVSLVGFIGGLSNT